MNNHQCENDNMLTLIESLDYMDLADQVSTTITVDEYAAKMGKDKDIVTLTFKVNSKLAADDLVSWFERGYDFVLDASVSEGEIEDGKYLVFVEIQRRSTVPKRIVQLLSDLETLTGLELAEWTVEVEGDEYEADPVALQKAITCNPNVYKDQKDSVKEVENKLNEYRSIAGLETKSVYTEDEYIRNLKNIAGL